MLLQALHPTTLLMTLKDPPVRLMAKARMVKAYIMLLLMCVLIMEDMDARYAEKIAIATIAESVEQIMEKTLKTQRIKIKRMKSKKSRMKSRKKIKAQRIKDKMKRKRRTRKKKIKKRRKKKRRLSIAHGTK